MLTSVIELVLPVLFFKSNLTSLVLSRMKIKTTRRKRTQSWRLTLLDFKTYYEATITTVMWHMHKDGCTDQWKRTESSEMAQTQTSVGNCFLTRELRLLNGEGIESQQIVLEKHMQRMNGTPTSLPIQKVSTT